MQATAEGVGWGLEGGLGSLCLSGLCCGKERRLPVLREDLDDLMHLLLEPNLEDAVRLVDDQACQVAIHKALGVLEVV